MGNREHFKIGYNANFMYSKYCKPANFFKKYNPVIKFNKPLVSNLEKKTYSYLNPKYSNKQVAITCKVRLHVMVIW